MQDSLADFVLRTKEAILAKEDVNVIMVNWVNGANLEYDQSAQNTRVVGALIAYFMRTISVSDGIVLVTLVSSKHDIRF